MRGRARLLVGVSAGLALMSMTTPVSAGPPEGGGAKAAILPLEVEGELSDADRASLTTELVSGLTRGSFEVVAPQAVVAASPKAEGCSDAGCLKTVAADTGATHVVRTVIEVKDRDYSVRVELYDGNDGANLARSEDGCEICGVADVGKLISTEAATLRTKLDALATGPATLILNSEPPGAEVLIDGELAGVTPFERSVIPGKHVVRVAKDGFISVEREVTFVEGVEEKIAMELDKVPSKLPGRTWGWVSLGVGVAAIGGGVGLTFLHDRQYQADCSGGNVDTNGECRFLHDTKWAGMGVALAGGALTTLGVAILLNAPKSKSRGGKKRAHRPNFGVGPGSVTVSGSF